MTTESIVDDREMSGHYGDGIADVYDLLYPEGPDAQECADFVASLTPEAGSVLEMGVGTGRLALPIAGRGLRVCGVDASEKMLDRLATRDEHGRVERHHATFTTVDLPERFDTLLAAYNALCCAPDQSEQLRVMYNLRRHVKDGGHLVIETYDPSIHFTAPANESVVKPLGPGRAVLESVQVAKANQMVFMTNVTLAEGAPDITVGFMRYLWPSEIDLMAGAAGFELVSRHAGWGNGAFEANGEMCVSVYRAAGGGRG